MKLWLHPMESSSVQSWYPGNDHMFMKPNKDKLLKTSDSYHISCVFGNNSLHPACTQFTQVQSAIAMFKQSYRFLIGSQCSILVYMGSGIS